MLIHSNEASTSIRKKFLIIRCFLNTYKFIDLGCKVTNKNSYNDRESVQKQLKQEIIIECYIHSDIFFYFCEV